MSAAVPISICLPPIHSPDLLEALTNITGKPVMLPAFGYGLTIVNNEQELSYSIVYRL